MRDIREIIRDNEEAVRRFGRTCQGPCGELKKSVHERRDPTDKTGETKRLLCTECFRELCLMS